MILRPQHNEYIKPELNHQGYSSFHHPEGEAWSGASWDEIYGVFNREHFQNPGHPVLLGKFPLPQAPNVLRIPIKRPQTDFRLPKQLRVLEDLVRVSAQHECEVNPRVHDMHVHLTYHREFVLAGESQRMAGWHVDGFQGSHKASKPVEHSYIITNADPTEFSSVGYDLRHFGTWTHMFHVLDGRVDKGSTYEIEDHGLYLMTCYQVHRTKPVTKDRYRAFFRLTYAWEELKDNRNTVNPYFDGQKYPVRPDIRDILKEVP